MTIRSAAGELTVRRATADDFDHVNALMAEAATWLKARGINQWNWFLTEPGRQYIRRRIESAEVYLVFSETSQPIATLTLQWDDSDFWGERGRDGSAGYVHGLAVSRRFAGHGLGRDLLAFAERLTLARGRRLLRLDCMATNAALCDYYREAGFIEQGMYSAKDNAWSVRLFERNISAK